MNLAEEYPNAKLAVRFCDSSPFWDKIRQSAQGKGVEYIMDGFRFAADPANGPPEYAHTLSIVRRELDTPDFARYLAAKLGAL